MQNGLTSSCLQQREASAYPYMFHDPLHSLSSSYNSRGCNPAVAHAQPTTHPSYASNAPSAVPVSTGTGKYEHLFSSKLILHVIYCHLTVTFKSLLRFIHSYTR